MSNKPAVIYILESAYDGQIYTPSFFSTFKEAQKELCDIFCGQLYEMGCLKEFIDRFGDMRTVDFEETDEENRYPCFMYNNQAEIGHGYFCINSCGPMKAEYVADIKAVPVSALHEAVQNISKLIS